MARADIYYARYRQTGESDYIRSCVRDLETIVARYSTSARFQANLAARRSDAGDSEGARQSALEAMEIEAVNREWGHRDQFLSPEEQETIDRILMSSAE